MNLSRRFFVFGGGALVTASFASKARAFAVRTGRPLLAAPDQVTGELHIYQDSILSLGPYVSEGAVQPITWFEYLTRYAGERIETQADLERVLRTHSLDEAEAFAPMSELSWPMAWEIHVGPTAQAYHLLKSLNLGADLKPERGAGHTSSLNFLVGGHPGDSSHWVEAPHPVTVSLLQARLMELGSGLKIIPH
jgi:hypothetical protein